MLCGIISTTLRNVAWCAEQGVSHTLAMQLKLSDRLILMLSDHALPAYVSCTRFTNKIWAGPGDSGTRGLRLGLQ